MRDFRRLAVSKPIAPLLTLPEAASRLRVSVATLRRWGRVGRLQMVRLPGGTLRVQPGEIERIERGGLDADR